MREKVSNFSFYRVFSLLSVFILAGCASSRVEEYRSIETGLAFEEAMVLLGRATYSDNETEESFTDCMADSLSKGERPIRVFSQTKFKDDFYPWFEPRVEPTSAEDLRELFVQPGVRERITERNIRYIVWIEGDTVRIDDGGTMSCTIGPWGGGCLGFSYWEEDASYKATIWDLERMISAGQISTDSKGTSYIAGVIIPIPILARPGNAACNALATQLKQFLLGS
ncbi:MAG: hypothetical protein CMQ40_00620 [Gammaproteobacteria bacterium]|nr:hypothetical protein [Gammaproteobacteria bacterium]